MLPLSDPDIVRRTRPYATLTLIALSSLVFLYELTLGELGQAVFFYRFGLIPVELTEGGEFASLRTAGELVDITTPFPTWSTLLSSMFIHGGFFHFAGNMLYLWVFGDNVEDRMGHLRFLAFYLASGLAATALHLATNLTSETPAIGASGAIAGVLGAYILLFPHSRINTLVFFYFITHLRIPAIFLLGVWFLMQLFSGMGSLGAGAGTTGVAYWAHVGGFAAGVAVVALWRLFRRRSFSERPRLNI